MAEPRTPKWQKLADDLRGKIKDGTYPPETVLPKIADYAAGQGVAYATAHHAYKALEQEGLIRQSRRGGSVVCDTPSRQRLVHNGLVTRDTAGYHFTDAGPADDAWEISAPRTSSEPAPPRIAELLRLEPGHKTLRLQHVAASAGQDPCQLVETWIAPAAAEEAPHVAEPSSGPGDYLDRLEEAGHGPLAWERTWGARMPSREEAAMLRISTGVPLLESTTVGTSARTNTPVEVTIRLMPGDRCEITEHLERDETAQWPVKPAEYA
ncbi:GntR family transcriptional regulator [Streptomyces luteireticuli]|uniref:GntR family transcriptional regulator n=1 Tax=Streptomyces luteireticuli TaxID=173858 RepID=UPI00355844DE